MNCFACERNLSAYMDDELSLETRLEIEAHLDECSRCRAEFEAHQAAWETAHLARTEPAPDGLWARIEAQLAKPGSTTRLEDLALMLRGLAAQVQDLQRTVDGLRQDLEEEGEQEQVRQGIRVRANPLVPIPPERLRESSIERLRRSS